MQMKIAMSCHYIPIIMAKNKSKEKQNKQISSTSAGDHVELLDSFTLIIGIKCYTATFENSCLK